MLARIEEARRRLAADGLVTATEEYTGKRRRTVYAITAKGRGDLAAWLRTPSAEPSWENEALVKVSFADGGDLESLRGTLTEMRDAARARLAAVAEQAAEPPAFPDRRHLTALTSRLHHDHEQATARWADWALEQIATWTATDDPGSWDADAALGALGSPGPLP